MLAAAAPSVNITPEPLSTAEGRAAAALGTTATEAAALQLPTSVSALEPPPGAAEATAGATSGTGDVMRAGTESSVLPPSDAQQQPSAAAAASPVAAVAPEPIPQAAVEVLSLSVAEEADVVRARTVGRREALAKRLVGEATRHAAAVGAG